MFAVNQALLNKARAILSQHPQIYWIIGGSCTGKSTVARAICRTGNATLYDMDEQAFGHYMSRYRMERHPASKTWFSAENPLAWSLSLSWETFDALYKTANSEYLDLMADDLARSEREYPLLVDGGITHPSILAQAIPPENIVCIEMPETERVRIWETSQERAEMREWIHQLPDPDRMWRKFLLFDKNITHTIGLESRENHIRRSFRDGECSINELAGEVAKGFGLGEASKG